MTKRKPRNEKFLDRSEARIKHAKEIKKAGTDQSITSTKMNWTRGYVNHKDAGGAGYYDELVRVASGRQINAPNRLVSEVTKLLGHKTGITARLWYRLMPNDAAFDYALKATQSLCGSDVKDGRTKYFVKTLTVAYIGGDRFKRYYKWAWPKICEILGVAATQESVADDADVQALREHRVDRPGCFGCDVCWTLKQRVIVRELNQKGQRWSIPNVETPVPQTT